MICTICNQPLMNPTGNPNSPILLIRAEVSDDPRADTVLQNELGREGISLGNVMTVYLKKHPHTIEFCKDADFKQLVTEVTGKRAVLLLGSEVVEFATNLQVMDVTGLRVSSYILPTVELMVASVSPGIALNSTLGEFRLSIQKFARMWQEIERKTA